MEQFQKRRRHGRKQLARSILCALRRAMLCTLVVFATLLVCAPVAAQNATILEEQYERVRAAATVSPLGDSPFGEHIDLMTGAVSFFAKDVEVPLNSGLPMELGRKFDTTKIYGGPGSISANQTRLLGPLWDLDIPYMRGVFDLRTGWVGTGTTQFGSLQRCSGGMTPPDVPGQIQFSNRTYTAADYWGGTFISIPGAGEEEVFGLSADRPRPGNQYGAVTRSEIRIGCLQNLKRGSGEGFVAVLPNGTKYYFDWMWHRDYTSIQDIHCGSTIGVIVWGGTSSNCVIGVSLPRVEVFIYATRVEDRFGNFLTYNYDTDPSRPFRLNSITSSEGTSIELLYDGDGKIDRVISEGRTWQYAYSGSGTGKTLSSVAMPGGLSWTFAGGTVSNYVPATSLWNVCTVRPGTMTSAQPPGPGESNAYTITHPSGAVGEFKLRRIVHGTNRTWGSCTLTRIGFSTAGFDAPVFTETPKAYVGVSLYEKTITGPALPSPLTWSYSYFPTWSWSGECNTGTCSDTSQTRVVAPSGVATTYTFGNTFTTNYGLLLSESVATGTTEVQRIDSQYVEDATGQAFPTYFGGSLNGALVPARNRMRPLLRRTLYRDGDAYVSQTNAFDQFARPLSISETGNGPTRTLGLAYYDNYASWVIGQPGSLALDGTVYSETTYTPNAQPHVRREFGRIVETDSYHADGTLAWTEDGNSNRSTFNDWMRGVPQTIRFPATPEAPGGATRTASVNGRGLVASITDENGYTTSYTYDDAGRLTRVDQPTQDSVTWNPEIFSYSKLTTQASGVPPGSWFRTRTVGKLTEVTIFDALMRPIVEESWDATAFRWGSTTRQIVRRYDPAGNVAFESYPVRRSITTSLDWSTEGDGRLFWYDALKRPTRLRESSELGSLDTYTYYLQGGRTQVVNARQKATTTTFRTYGHPDVGLPIRIEQPEGITTDVVRDAFGKPQVVTRFDAASGVTLSRQFAYNAFHQLCKEASPEQGATIVGYDGAGNLTWSAPGLGASTACAERQSFLPAQIVARGYDARNRLISVTFPDGRGNRSSSYWPDGLLRTETTYNQVGSAPVVRSYNYNKRRLLESESMIDDDGYSWAASYQLNPNGDLASLVYPSGRVLDVSPNSIGQPMRVGEFASAISYHPNGGVAEFTYGNGLRHITEQNSRGLPKHTTDGAGVLDDWLDYDQVGNVIAISDGTAGARRDTDMVYDGVDRLKTATSPIHGNASFEYNSFDSLTRMQLGAPFSKDHHYCYDNLNRLTNVKTGGCDGSTVGALGYDGAGNVTNKNGQEFDFDLGRRLRAVKNKEQYSYDGTGLRVTARSTSGAIRTFYTRGGQLLAQRDERRKESYDYISLNGSLIARVKTDHTVPFLSADAIGKEGAYQVRWTVVESATGYVLEEIHGTQVTTENFAASQTTRSFTAKPEGTYRYRVRACFDSDCRPWSTAVDVRSLYQPTQIPNVNLDEYSYTGNVYIFWSASARGDWYEIEEWAGASWMKLPNVTTLTTDVVRLDGVYSYRVRACNDAGCSSYSAADTITVVRPPSGVLNLSGPGSNSTGTYSMSWNSVPGATRYEVDEYIYGAWTTGPSSTTNVTVSDRDTGTYYYKVRACNRTCGGDSNTVTVQVHRPPRSAPSISVPTLNTTGQYSVNWQPIWSATSYVLEEQTNGGSWYTIYSGGTATFPVGGKSSGTYAYRARACNDAGCGGFGPSVSLQVTLSPSSAPSLYVDGIGWEGDSYSVSWTAVIDATSYELQGDYNNNWVFWSIYSGGAREWWSPGQGAGLYGYRVRGCNWVGCGPWSGKQIINIYSNCSSPPCIEVLRREEDAPGSEE